MDTRVYTQPSSTTLRACRVGSHGEGVVMHRIQIDAEAWDGFYLYVRSWDPVWRVVLGVSAVATAAVLVWLSG